MIVASKKQITIPSLRSAYLLLLNKYVMGCPDQMPQSSRPSSLQKHIYTMNFSYFVYKERDYL